jgi:hypothetical protein
MANQLSSTATFCLLLTFCADCGAGDAGAVEEVDAGTYGRGVTDPQTPVGGFVIDLVSARGSNSAYTAVQGKVYDGPVPSPIVWSVMEEAAGCRLLVPRVPFCSPGCGGTAVCAEDGRCDPYPAAQNLGRVEVTGLGAGTFGMDAIGGTYQPSASVSLPYPPFSEGAAVQLAAEGSVSFPSFSLSGQGIAPIEVRDEFALAEGKTLPVVWAPPAVPGAGAIEVKLDISHHGGTRGKIECEVADSGSLEIPASQISKLLALGVAGFPTIVVTRVASGSTATSRGQIGLRVVSGMELEVEIPGLRSCTSNDDCPSGQRCQADLSCG